MDNDPRSAAASRLTLIGGLVGLILAIVFLVSLSRRVGSLEDRLTEAQQREHDLAEQIRQGTIDEQSYRKQSEAARDAAFRAAAEAGSLERDRTRAEWERELALEMADRAREDSQLAAQEAGTSQAEYDRLRQARRRELDRMSKALAEIVETERTPLGMVMRLGEESLQFDFDKDSIREQDRELLSRIAGVLLASHGFRLYVDGHTDAEGPAAYNKQLSERRAAAVKEYFVAAGVPQPIMEVRGFGEASPRVRGGSATARQRNRRVEIGVVDTVIDYEADPASVQP